MIIKRNYLQISRSQSQISASPSKSQDRELYFLSHTLQPISSLSHHDLQTHQEPKHMQHSENMISFGINTIFSQFTNLGSSCYLTTCSQDRKRKPTMKERKLLPQETPQWSRQEKYWHIDKYNNDNRRDSVKCHSFHGNRENMYHDDISSTLQPQLQHQQTEGNNTMAISLLILIRSPKKFEEFKKSRNQLYAYHRLQISAELINYGF